MISGISIIVVNVWGICGQFPLVVIGGGHSKAFSLL
jgi:hypothetical protein